MERFQKVGVFLRDATTDDAALAFSAHMDRLGVRTLHCVWVIDEEEAGPAADAAAQEARVRSALPADLADRLQFQLRRGHFLEQVLRFARDEDLDLVIIGRKLPSSQVGLGTLIAKVVRKCPCSVLVVPELSQAHFARVLVAIDCSAHSREAMETAVELAASGEAEKGQLLAVTVRQVTTRYDLAGVTFEESCAAQRNRGEKDLANFLEQVDTRGLSVESRVLLSDRPAEAISEAAMVRKMDVVVAGSRGATLAAAALLGSTSENLLMTCALPVLIVKKKGETLHFLEALFST